MPHRSYQSASIDSSTPQKKSLWSACGPWTPAAQQSPRETMDIRYKNYCAVTHHPDETPPRIHRRWGKLHPKSKPLAGRRSEWLQSGPWTTRSRAAFRVDGRRTSRYRLSLLPIYGRHRQARTEAEGYCWPGCLVKRSPIGQIARRSAAVLAYAESKVVCACSGGWAGAALTSATGGCDGQA